MSANSHSSVESDSSSDVSDSNTLDEWEERVHEQNHQIDSIIENMLLNNPNLIVGAQNSTVKRRFIDREREIGEERLMKDYFVCNPTYSPELFRRRFRMQKSLFLRIVEAVTINDTYFQEGNDCTGRKSLSPLQKCTGAMRVLAYGISADVVDEYLRMSATVTRDAIIHFVEGVISCFGDTYLRRPNKQDLERLLYVERAFGVLQARFAFIRRPCLVWDKDLMEKIMMVCIIMHNMIVEDERDTYLYYYDPTEFLMDVPSGGEIELPQYSTARIASLSTYMVNRDQLGNREAHSALQNDLIEHIWEKFGTNN